MVLLFLTFKCLLGRACVILVSLFCGKISEISAKNGTLVHLGERVVLVSLCVVTLLSLFCGKISENSAKNGTLVSDI